MTKKKISLIFLASPIFFFLVFLTIGFLAAEPEGKNNDIKMSCSKAVEKEGKWKISEKEKGNNYLFNKTNIRRSESERKSALYWECLAEKSII